MTLPVVRRRALWAAVAAIAVLAGGVVANAPAQAASDTTIVQFTGDAADSLTHGQPRAFAPPATAVSLSGTASAVQISVVGDETWDVAFVAPAAGTLTVGTTYPAVQPDDMTSSAGFDLSSAEASCTTVSATFTVLDIATDAETGDVTAFAASFDSHCNGSLASARGVVYVHSSLAYAATTTATLGGPASSFAGGSVDLAGTLEGPGGPIAGAIVALSRLDGAVTTTFADAVTAADGSWTATVPFGNSTATYTAAYAGDSGHTAAQKHLVVALRAPETSTLSLEGPDSAYVSTTVELDGVLSGPGGPIAGAAIALSRTDAQGTVALPPVVTDVDGGFTTTAPLGTSDATYTAAYAGSAEHAAVQKTWVVTATARATSTLTVTGPASALATSSVDVSGSLTGSSGAVAGATITLSRTDTAGTTSLTSAVTADDGSWTATVPLGLTDGTFTASYAGDFSHDAAQATTTVAATRDPSTLTLVLPTAASPAVAYTVSGVLSAGGTPLVDELITLRRTDLAGTRTFTVRTNASGVYAYRDVPSVGGVVTWRATWAGDATHVAANVSKSFTVTRLRTLLTIKATATSYSYGARALITVHLGKTYNSRYVNVYARPLGILQGGTKLIARVKVNSLGNAVVSHILRARTVFTVRFDGDYRYDVAAVSTTTPMIRAYVSVTLSGYYKKLGSTYLFHAVDPKQVITVLPYRPGKCFSTTVQALQHGKWGTVARLSCGKLDYTSHGYATLRSNRPLGILFRISASVASDTASQSVAATSPWVYLQFT